MWACLQVLQNGSCVLMTRLSDGSDFESSLRILADSFAAADDKSLDTDRAVCFLSDVASRLAPIEAREWLVDKTVKWASEQNLSEHPAVKELRRLQEFFQA